MRKFRDEICAQICQLGMPTLFCLFVESLQISTIVPYLLFMNSDILILFCCLYYDFDTIFRGVDLKFEPTLHAHSPHTTANMKNIWAHLNDEASSSGDWFVFLNITNVESEICCALSTFTILCQSII